VTVPVADTLLIPVARIDGCELACLIDASTGMVVAAMQHEGSINLPAAAGGAADIANVVALLSGELATGDGLEDVILTFNHHFHVIRPVRPDMDAQILLLVILDRMRTNLAMARRAIRDFCTSLSA
jgi:hypothetical protein